MPSRKAEEVVESCPKRMLEWIVRVTVSRTPRTTTRTRASSATRNKHKDDRSDRGVTAATLVGDDDDDDDDDDDRRR